MKKVMKELRKIRRLPFHQRTQYIWDYYKFHILLLIFCIVFISYFLLPLFSGNGKNTLLSIAIIDSNVSAKNDTSSLSEDLLSYFHADKKKDAIVIDTSGGTYDTSSSSTIKISILLSSVGENDVIICGKDLYEKFESKGAFMDWENVSDDLSPAVSSQLSGTAFDLSACHQWKELHLTDYSPVYACIPVSCKHPERAASFLNYLYSKEDE
mgnify:FL=1